MSRIGVALMAAALLVYLAVAIWLAVMFISVGTPVSIGMGITLLVLAPIGAWALVREMMFGFGADRLGRLLDAEGGMPPVETELTPSGRIARADADPLIARYTAEADAASGYREMLVAADATDIVYTPAVSSVPASFLRASLEAAGIDPDADPGGVDLTHLTRPGEGGAMAWRDVWSAGQGAGAIHDVVPTAQLVRRLTDEFSAACKDFDRKRP